MLKSAAAGIAGALPLEWEEIEMNETLRCLAARKSVRVFEDRPVSAEVKGQILGAMMRGPTAGNAMYYSVIDVTDRGIKEQLAVSCDNQPFIGTAPLVWVFLADCRRWMRKFQQAGCEGIPPLRLSDLILAANDAVIAAQTACIAAESLGLGSCYIGDIIEQWETHQALLQLPAYVAPVSMLVLGYPTPQQRARKQTSRFPEEMIVFENGYRELTDDELRRFQGDEAACAFFKRKVRSAFSEEMRRSMDRIFENWQGLGGGDESKAGQTG